MDSLRSVLLNRCYLCDQIKKNEMGRAWETGEVHTVFWWGDLMERDHLEDTSVDGTITLKWIFKKLDGEGWTGVIWLRTGAGGWCL
jgi:hypothetical protein